MYISYLKNPFANDIPCSDDCDNFFYCVFTALKEQNRNRDALAIITLVNLIFICIITLT